MTEENLLDRRYACLAHQLDSSRLQHQTYENYVQNMENIFEHLRICQDSLKRMHERIAEIEKKL